MNVPFQSALQRTYWVMSGPVRAGLPTLKPSDPGPANTLSSLLRIGEGMHAPILQLKQLYSRLESRTTLNLMWHHPSKRRRSRAATALLDLAEFDAVKSVKLDATDQRLLIDFDVPVALLPLNQEDFLCLIEEPMEWSEYLDFLVLMESLGYIEMHFREASQARQMTCVPKPSWALFEQPDPPYCSKCGTLTARAGSVFGCPQCGAVYEHPSEPPKARERAV